MKNILIIDDDIIFSKALQSLISRQGYTVKSTFTLKEGLNEIHSDTKYELVLLDVKLPDGNGLHVLPEIKESPSQPEIIIMTGEGDPNGAELAINSGAWDYIEKGSSHQRILLSFSRAAEYIKKKSAEKPPLFLKRDGIIGNSSALSQSLEKLAQASCSTANVLITGETGTGKEIFASAIHKNSNRADNNFVVVDCGALPENLIESMLFGHEKGAFTGAEKSTEGLIKQADGGTLFLDEIGELPLSLQKAFLRVLQEHRFRPVGSKAEVDSDFRLITATNKNLEDLVKQNKFREDLLFRIKSLTIELPPLRKRKEDIKAIVLHYIDSFYNQLEIETKGIHPEYFEALYSYDWPGNVRELINVLQQSVLDAIYEPILFRKHLPANIRLEIIKDTISKSNDEGSIPEINGYLKGGLPRICELRKSTMVSLEKRYLRDLTTLTSGDMKQACQVSGLSKSRLYELLNKYNIPHK
jgi:two-component system NtrC family response regulator